jgi:hypothetical protein
MGAVMACGSRTGLLDDGGNAGLRDAGPDTPMRDADVDVFEAQGDGCDFSCDGQCVNPQTDHANCGACGNACPVGESCVSGVCLLPCEGGLAACADGGEQACVDTDADETNCGACGLDCRAGRPCVGGHCIVPNCAQALAPRVAYPTGRYPSYVVLGDLNGDGALDVVVSNEADDNVGVHLGRGDGTLLPQTIYTTNQSPNGLAISDLNRDGKPDLVVTDLDLNSSVSVLLGNGDGTFQAQASYPTGPWFGPLAVGDINGDGAPDVVVSSVFYYPSSVGGILLGHGDGTLGPFTTFTTVDEPDSLVIADLIPDSHADLVSGNGNAATLSVMLGNGDGTFVTATTLSPFLGTAYTGFALNTVVVSDLNLDGTLDIAFVSQTTPLYPSLCTVRVWLGGGDGTFQPSDRISVGHVSTSLDVGDINGDGDPDLAVANDIADTVTVLLGRGDGTFQSEGNFAAGSSAYVLAVGDMNSDGLSDVVVANEKDDTVSVLLSTCTP